MKREVVEDVKALKVGDILRCKREITEWIIDRYSTYEVDELRLIVRKKNGIQYVPIDVVKGRYDVPILFENKQFYSKISLTQYESEERFLKEMLYKIGNISEEELQKVGVGIFNLFMKV